MTKREKRVCIAGFWILIVLTVFIAACTTPDSGTGIPVIVPVQPVQADTGVSLKITEPATTPIQDEQLDKIVDRTRLQNLQPDGPVSLTINSARKQTGLGIKGDVNTEPMPGNVFLVLDITIKNNGMQEGFILNRTSIVARDLEHGTFTNRTLYIRESLQKFLEKPVIFPVTLKQNDTITGQVLLEMNDSTDYQVNLIDGNRNRMASRLVSFGNLLTTDNPVSITIHSAKKVPNFTTTFTNPGHIFLILNITMKNNGIKDGFELAFTSTTIKDLRSGDFHLHSANGGESYKKDLEKPIILPTGIKQNGSITGQLLFIVADSTDYRLNLIDDNRTIIASRDIHV